MGWVNGQISRKIKIIRHLPGRSPEAGKMWKKTLVVYTQRKGDGNFAVLVHGGNKNPLKHKPPVGFVSAKQMTDRCLQAHYRQNPCHPLSASPAHLDDSVQ